MPASPTEMIPETPLNISARPRICNVEAQPVDPWPFGSALDLPHRLWLTSARAAIAHALRHARLNAGDEVLLPAYACGSMIAPVEFLGLSPTYYALDADLRLTVEELDRRRTPSTRALLLTRYHGFAYKSVDIYEHCRRHRIVVIEDRAHAFFGPAGAQADYVVYSAPKFFPVFEGGLLASASQPVEQIGTTMAPLAFQLKTALWPYDYASDYSPPPSRDLLVDSALRLKRRLQASRRRNENDGSSMRAVGPAAADGGAGLEPYWVDKSISWPTRRAILRANLDWIAARRRCNWERLVRRLSSVDDLRMIHPRLDPDVVPYAAAFIVPNPDKIARALRRVNVPLYRWDSFALQTNDATLRDTVALSHRIFQIPTHQSMSEDDIDRIADAVAFAIAASETD